jgi:hypothetical protein
MLNVLIDLCIPNFAFLFNPPIVDLSCCFSNTKKQIHLNFQVNTYQFSLLNFELFNENASEGHDGNGVFVMINHE